MWTGLRFPLDESQQLLRETVYRFAQSHIASLATRTDRENDFPSPLWLKMGAQGLLGITVGEAYGGTGAGYLEQALIMEEVSRASGSIGLSYSAHSNLCLNQIYLNANETLKQRYLPSLCSGNTVGALAMSEANAGSDVMHMQLFATNKGEHFVLNGTKMWITNGPDASVFVVYAKTKEELNGHNKITAFIIEKGFPGFSTAQKLDKLGMRGSNTCELVFENCRVPKENVLGKIHEGACVLMSGLDYERVILAAGPVGIMQACFDLVLPYLRQREQFGQPIGNFQLMQAKLADMYVTLSTSRCYLYQIAQACDQGHIKREDAAALILYTSEAATQMALQTIQCLGGNGYISEYPAGRLLRDAKLYEIGAGTNEIRRMLIGRELFNKH